MFISYATVGYGFSVVSNDDSVQVIKNLQRKLGSSESEQDSAFAQELLSSELFPNIEALDFYNEDVPSDPPMMVFIIKNSCINISGNPLPPLSPQKLVFPKDGLSWSDGMKELAILGEAFGLPKENDHLESDSYTWIFMNKLI